MAKSLVTNVCGSPITLPPPYIGIIPPGVSVVIDQPTQQVIAALYAVPSVARFLTVSETSDASRTTITVSTPAAAAATEQVIAEITSPLDLNGQRAINAGAPVDATDLATKAYVDATSGGGTVTSVTASAPLASSGGITPDISLNDSGVIAGTYGDPTATDQSSVPSITVSGKGLISAATASAIKIGGSDAKAYVDAADAATLSAANSFAESLAFGISSKEPAHTATTAPLPANSANGTFQTLTANANGLLPAIGGHTLTVGQRVLVKDEAGAAQVNNGIYVVTDLGSNDPGGSPWVLTRSPDANTASELCGSTIPVETGDLAGSVWIFAANSTTFAFGTTPVIWTELSVSAATPTTLGTVKLAGGLGGGSNANLPQLNVDPANVGGGTLAALRGGTGLTGTGGAGNLGKLLTADGAGGYALEAPASVVIARTYYVATNGSDTPGVGDGSLSRPFATIDAAQTQANADLASTDYAQIIVGPGTYVGNVTLSRPRTLIEGAGGRVEAQASRITGQVLVTPSGAVGKFSDTIYLSGFFVQPASGSADAALRLISNGLFQFVATDCYFTTVSASPTAVAISDETTNTGRPRIFLQDCVVSIQTSGPTRTVAITNADTRIFRSQVGHASSVVSPASSVVVITLAGTLWADSTIFEAQTTAGVPISCIGSASATTRLILSNCSVANTLSFVNGGVLVNANNVALISQTTFSIPAGSTYAVSGTGTLVYANLTFLPGTQTALQPTLVAATETHGTLLLPSLGSGALVKNTATGAVTVVAPTVPGNVLTADGTAWVSAPPSVNTADFGLVNAPGGPYPGIPANSLVAVVNGTVVLADAFSTSSAPVSGVYTGAASNQIRTSGKQSGFVGLPANAKLYLAVGGGFSTTPPLVSSGRVCQAVGYSIGTTELFVQPEDEIVYS